MSECRVWFIPLSFFSPFPLIRTLRRGVSARETRYTHPARSLKSEIDVLRGLMSELTGALSQTNTVSNYSDTNISPLDGACRSRKRVNRSSVATLAYPRTTFLTRLRREAKSAKVSSGQILGLFPAKTKSCMPLFLGSRSLLTLLRRTRTPPIAG
jgi:hypothetical protein